MKKNLLSDYAKPMLSNRPFWDAKRDNIDFNAQAQYVIIMTIDRGKYQDLIEILRFYGVDRVKNELLNAVHLPDRILYFASTLFDINKEQFKCYSSKH